MDGLYLRSLLATLVVYSAIVVGLVIFVFMTGIAGVFTISGIVILLLCYFYGCFKRKT